MFQLDDLRRTEPKFVSAIIAASASDHPHTCAWIFQSWHRAKRRSGDDIEPHGNALRLNILRVSHARRPFSRATPLVYNAFSRANVQLLRLGLGRFARSTAGL